jgi:hypothetical protein
MTKTYQWRSFADCPLPKADFYNLRILGGNFKGDAVFVTKKNEKLEYSHNGESEDIEPEWLYMFEHEWEIFLKRENSVSLNDIHTKVKLELLEARVSLAYCMRKLDYLTSEDPMPAFAGTLNQIAISLKEILNPSKI